MATTSAPRKLSGGELLELVKNNGISRVGNVSWCNDKTFSRLVDCSAEDLLLDSDVPMTGTGLPDFYHVTSLPTVIPQEDIVYRPNDRHASPSRPSCAPKDPSKRHIVSFWNYKEAS